MSSHNKKKKAKLYMYIIAICSVAFAAVMVSVFLQMGNSMSKAKEEPAVEKKNTGFYKASPGTYDSADTAVVERIDSENQTIDFLNMSLGRTYTLSYDGTTEFFDKYDAAMSPGQLSEGDIVELTFLKEYKSATTVKMSPDAFAYDEVSKYRINSKENSASIGSDVYHITDSTVFLSAGESVIPEDIIQGDVVSINGIGRDIYSVVVERGHGYLRVEDNEYLRGGWIEVGQEQIQQISGEMLMAVPEGTYEVRITSSGVDVSKNVTVVRGKETVLNVSDIQAAEEKIGQIIFAISPSTARLYIDGQQVDTTGAVQLSYGIHQIMAMADGYDTLTQYIKVGQEMATISITLEVASGNNSKGNSDTVSGNTTLPNDILSTDGYKIYVDAPANVQVYFDGSYKGIVPCNFKKQSGAHTITLSRTGYVTKSYSVEISSEDGDVTYSFSELEIEGSYPGGISGNSPSGNSPSGNSPSGNINKPIYNMDGPGGENPAGDDPIYRDKPIYNMDGPGGENPDSD